MKSASKKRKKLQHSGLIEPWVDILCLSTEENQVWSWFKRDKLLNVLKKASAERGMELANQYCWAVTLMKTVEIFGMKKKRKIRGTNHWANCTWSTIKSLIVAQCKYISYFGPIIQ